MVEKKICRARLRPNDDASTPDHRQLTIARQCELLGLPRSTRYHVPVGESAENLALMKRIDEQYLQTPFYGSRKMALELGINRKRRSVDASDGLAGDLSETSDHAAGGRTQDLPLFTAESGDHSARPGVGQRHHLHSAASRLFVSGSGDGLVQPLCVGVALVEHAGGKFLLGGPRRGAGQRSDRRFSTAIKDHSSRPRPSPADWRNAAWRSRWTAAAEHSTTCSSSGCGGA